MKILVDTCVWSLALRRNNPAHGDPYVAELRELINEVRVQIVGPIRQEILSGLISKSQFKKLREHLRYFPDLELSSGDYERAAEFYNLNRKKGIQGSNTDFLICAVSERHNIPILTTDNDFILFRKHINIKLHTPRTLKS